MRHYKELRSTPFSTCTKVEFEPPLAIRHESIVANYLICSYYFIYRKLLLSSPNSCHQWRGAGVRGRLRFSLFDMRSPEYRPTGRRILNQDFLPAWSCWATFLTCREFLAIPNNASQMPDGKGWVVGGRVQTGSGLGSGLGSLEGGKRMVRLGEPCPGPGRPGPLF
jgi:hypothetical protein